jgi:dTMP kinase
VKPALSAGCAVVSDRYVASSLAYQGGGRGLGVDEVRRLNEWATGGLWPDLTVLVRVRPAVAWERIARGRGAAGVDRLEGAGIGFLERVAATFDRLAADAVGGRWAVVDGEAPVDAVAAAVAALVLA